jgi:carbamoyltransferase
MIFHCESAHPLFAIGGERCEIPTVCFYPDTYAFILLDEFAAASGVPVIMNTAFNLRGEAIVNTPTNALRTFFSSGMDALVIGSFLVEK